MSSTRMRTVPRMGLAYLVNRGRMRKGLGEGRGETKGEVKSVWKEEGGGEAVVAVVGREGASRAEAGLDEFIACCAPPSRAEDERRARKEVGDWLPDRLLSVVAASQTRVPNLLEPARNDARGLTRELVNAVPLRREGQEDRARGLLRVFERDVPLSLFQPLDSGLRTQDSMAVDDSPLPLGWIKQWSDECQSSPLLRTPVLTPLSRQTRSTSTSTPPKHLLVAFGSTFSTSTLLLLCASLLLPARPRLSKRLGRDRFGGAPPTQNSFAGPPPQQYAQQGYSIPQGYAP